jgi:hypothetical protein
MNVELLQQVKQVILADPDSFRMDTWTCGTAHCIAGWALLLRDIPIVGGPSLSKQRTVSDEHPGDVAAELLGLSDDEQLSLFNCYHWPVEFHARYRESPDRRARAQVAAERIDHFIATAGRE